jgi:putative hemolysin
LSRKIREIFTTFYHFSPLCSKLFPFPPPARPPLGIPSKTANAIKTLIFAAAASTLSHDMTGEKTENPAGKGSYPEDKLVDLEKVIGKKNPRLLKMLPGFILRYIKRTVHQDEMNDFLRENGNKQDFEFAAAVLDYLDIEVNMVGLENIPREGGCILASNHPLGGIDGLALIKTVGTVRRDIKFLVNDILMTLEQLHGVFVPVNKLGRNATEAVAKMDEVYASEQAVLIFPAGLVSRKQKGGVIKDLEWKKSFITRARKYRKNVIPVFIGGNNSHFFYNLARWRKRAGIKANIEMFYLPDEMYKQRNKTITIIFGKPVPYETFDRSRTDSQWAEIMKEKVYELGRSVPA